MGLAPTIALPHCISHRSSLQHSDAKVGLFQEITARTSYSKNAVLIIPPEFMAQLMSANVKEFSTSIITNNVPPN